MLVQLDNGTYLIEWDNGERKFRVTSPRNGQVWEVDLREDMILPDNQHKAQKMIQDAENRIADAEKAIFFLDMVVDSMVKGQNFMNILKPQNR
jgi:hypothetical protein